MDMICKKASIVLPCVTLLCTAYLVCVIDGAVFSLLITHLHDGVNIEHV